MYQEIILPYLRNNIHIPRRDLVVSSADSLTLKVAIVDSDSPFAKAIVLSGGLGAPYVRLCVWSDHIGDNWWWNNGAPGAGWWDYGRPFPETLILYTLVGTPEGIPARPAVPVTGMITTLADGNGLAIQAGDGSLIGLSNSLGVTTVYAEDGNGDPVYDSNGVRVVLSQTSNMGTPIPATPFISANNGRFDLFIPPGKMRHWPLRCLWAMQLCFDGGNQVDTLAFGYLHIRWAPSIPASTGTPILTDASIPVLSDSSVPLEV